MEPELIENGHRVPASRRTIDLPPMVSPLGGCTGAYADNYGLGNCRRPRRSPSPHRKHSGCSERSGATTAAIS